MLQKFTTLLKSQLILGKEPQSFLGASWIPVFLNRVPAPQKRKWALRILNLSPHYFLNRKDPKYAGMTTDDYLNHAFEDELKARANIYEHAFKDQLEPTDIALEYGCGPGYVAKVLAPHVEKLYACDISPGVIACAEIVNHAANIEYILATDEGFKAIGDGELDVVCSFAMVQHLTDEVFKIVLENCRKKLKSGGRLAMHVQFEDEVWKPEEDWKNDESLYGKMKFKYGLHCFGRSRERIEELVGDHGFSDIKFKSLLSLGNDNSSESDSQFLMTAVKN